MYNRDIKHAVEKYFTSFETILGFLNDTVNATKIDEYYAGFKPAGNQSFIELYNDLNIASSKISNNQESWFPLVYEYNVNGFFIPGIVGNDWATKLA